MDKAALQTHIYNWQQHKRLMPLLPLLASSFEQAEIAVSEIYTQMPALSEANKPFLFEQLIIYALQFGGSGYWAEHAIKWLEQGAPITAGIAKATIALIAQKGATQQARQRAARLINQWQRSQASGD